MNDVDAPPLLTTTARPMSDGMTDPPLGADNVQEALDAPGSVHGRQLLDSKIHELEVTVQLTGSDTTITATLDERPLFRWAGAAASFDQSKEWMCPPSTLALGNMAADWAVYEVKVKLLE